MKKIAIISASYPPNIWNSQGRSTGSTAYGLSKEGYDVTIFTYTPKLKSSTIRDKSMLVQYIGGISQTDVTSLPFSDVSKWNNRLFNLLRQEKYDTVLLMNWHGWEAVSRYKKIHTCKTIGFAPFLSMVSRFFKPIEATLANDITKRESAYILGVDDLIAHTQRFAKKLSVYADRAVYVIPNCHLDLAEQAQYQIPVEKNQICFVGRANCEKNIERIIRVMPDLPEVNLVVSSPIIAPAYKGSLQGLAKTLDVEHRIEFTGWLPTKKVKDLYRASMLAIVPSQFEPYGYGALDPMALGVPVVVSEWSGLSEYVAREETVFSSLDMLKQQIYLAVTKPDEFDEAVNANKEMITTSLSETFITQSLMKIL